MVYDAVITLRYDETDDTFVLATQIPGLPTMEATSKVISDVFNDIAQQLENEGS